MRETVGKLICIWSPLLHGEGCSTITNAVGFALHHHTGKKILIVNKSSSLSQMETYITEDIEIKYNMDNLKIFNCNIKAEHINAYATQISNGLYMVAGSRINREITKEDKGFEELFIDRCLESFDMVVADMNTGISEDTALYLDKANSILAATAPNEIILDHIFKNPRMQEVTRYLKDERTVLIFNKLCGDWDTNKVISRFKKKYDIENAYGLNYDGDVLTACCMNRKFYSHMSKELKKRKSAYAEQISDICGYLMDKLYEEELMENNVQNHRALGKLLKSSFT